MLMKSPSAMSAVTTASVTSISMSVNPSHRVLGTCPLREVRPLPSMRVQVLGNLIDGRDDRDSDEPDDQPHDDHEDGLNSTREPLGHLVHIVLVEVREVLERAHQVPRRLPYRHHVREHRGEDVVALRYPARGGLTPERGLRKREVRLAVDHILGRFSGHLETLREAHTALE